MNFLELTDEIKCSVQTAMIPLLLIGKENVQVEFMLELKNLLRINMLEAHGYIFKKQSFSRPNK